MSKPPARRRLIRPATVLLAVVAGLLIGVGADVARSGGFNAWLTRHGLPPPYPPQGERYDIGERSLYLDCRGSGSPTVVLEAGCDDFVPKPYSPRQLLAKIRQYLP